MASFKRWEESTTMADFELAMGERTAPDEAVMIDPAGGYSQLFAVPGTGRIIYATRICHMQGNHDIEVYECIDGEWGNPDRITLTPLSKRCTLVSEDEDDDEYASDERCERDCDRCEYTTDMKYWDAEYIAIYDAAIAKILDLPTLFKSDG